MKHIILSLATAAMFFSPKSYAVVVDYSHPRLSILAKNERLASVMYSLGEEMDIFIDLPPGLDREVNCSIKNKPVDKALKALLDSLNLSYYMQWNDNNGRLAGLTIISDGLSSSENQNTSKQSIRSSYPNANHTMVIADSDSDSGNRHSRSLQLAIAKHLEIQDTERKEQEARLYQVRMEEEEKAQRDEDLDDTRERESVANNLDH